MVKKEVIDIVLADDHHLVRSGIKNLLNHFPHFNVTAEVSNGLEVFDVIQDQEVDLILMDIAMPKMNGITVTERVTKEYPQIKIIILSIYSDSEYITQSLQAGAKGYLLKTIRINELESAIQEVMEGRIYLCKEVAQKFYTDKFEHMHIGDSLVNQLTTRQKEVLQLIAEGNTTKEIADALYISIKTVDMHRHNLMKTLDIHDVAGLVKFAIEKKII